MRRDMLNPYILILLSEFDSADALVDTMLEAVAQAGRPSALHFAVSQALSSIELPDGAFPEGSVKAYDDQAELSAALSVVTDETHILAVCGPQRFAEKWDATLCARYALITEKRAVMTACIDEGQCFLPAFQQSFREHGVKLGAGLPLVSSAAPVWTMALMPNFVFAPIAFLREAMTDRSTLSLSAYAAGYSIYALDRPALWATDRRRARYLRQPSADAMPGGNRKRFEQLAGVVFDAEIVSYRASLGLFGPANTYPQRIRRPYALRRRLHSVCLRRAPKPLLVSAFVDLPDALHPLPSYLIRFGFLTAIQALPLVLYAGGSQERWLRSNFPNTLAYPDNALLPRTLLGEGMSRMHLFQRNKPLLLQRVLRSYPTYKHIAWVDADVLPHPIAPQAIPNFTALMDDRIHIATVNGEPDLTCMVMPRAMVRLLARETQAVTQLDSVMKRSFSPSRMMLRLMDKLPDIFAVHPMPQKGLLFLTCFEPELLSKALREQLSERHPVIRPVLIKEKKPNG